MFTISAPQHIHINALGVMQLGHETCTVVTVVSIVAGWSGVVSSSFCVVSCVMAIAYVLACSCFRCCSSTAMQLSQRTKLVLWVVCVSSHVLEKALCKGWPQRLHCHICVSALSVQSLHLPCELLFCACSHSPFEKTSRCLCSLHAMHFLVSTQFTHTLEFSRSVHCVDEVQMLLLLSIRNNDYDQMVCFPLGAI